MYESILTSSDTRKAALITSSGATFDLDLVTIESHGSTLRITENPVESGANVADHAVLDPKEITVNGLIVGYEPPVYKASDVLGFEVSDYPLPLVVRAVTSQAEAVVNRVASSFANLATETTRVIADWLPDYSQSITPSASTDRINELYENLLAIQKNGEFLTLSTYLKEYSNMLISSVTANADKKLSAEISIVFREVFIVETQTASGLKVKPQQSQQKRNLGKTNPKEVKEQDESGLSYLFGGGLKKAVS